MANYIEKCSSTQEHDALIDIENNGSCSDIVDALETSMTAKLLSDSPLPAKCCIFRVPEVLRRHKPEAYGPDVVSIGPFHRGGQQFQQMEDVKQCFYAESLDHINQIDFLEMMVLDGCFLIELFRKLSFTEQKRSFTGSVTQIQEELHIGYDPILKMDCMVQYLCHDLLLLENQLPWFVLQCLYDLTADDSPYPCLSILVLNFFSLLAPLASNFEYYSKQNRMYTILHILDLIRVAIVVPTKVFKSCHNIFESKLLPANVLAEAGIVFRRGVADSIMSIDFADGIFIIPQLAIGELTEPLFRNLIAFEQCYHGRSHKITSYALLMDNLINSSKDMDFLCDKGIIDNCVSSEDGSQFFNKLTNDTVLNQFYYDGLCAEVNSYYNVKWNRWLERLRRDYLCNPWKVTSLVAAFILLALTLVQTICTIIKK